MLHDCGGISSIHISACTLLPTLYTSVLVPNCRKEVCADVCHASCTLAAKTGGHGLPNLVGKRRLPFGGVAGMRERSGLFMATPRYVLNTTLPTGHSNSITALQFSPDGRFLASGSGDGVLMIFSTPTWKPVKRFVDASSVTAVSWHPTFPKTLVCGYASGDVHTMNFESHSLVSVSFYRPHRLC